MSGRKARQSRWAISFADLCLVLLAFFVLLQAQRGDPKRLAQGVRQAFGGGSRPVDDERLLAAAALFEPGEAVLMPKARAALLEIGRQAAARHARVRVQSVGADPASARFDGWELAAARTAAAARAIAGGGLDPRRIDVSVPETANGNGRAGQQLDITLSR